MPERARRSRRRLVGGAVVAALVALAAMPAYLALCSVVAARGRAPGVRGGGDRGLRPRAALGARGRRAVGRLSPRCAGAARGGPGAGRALPDAPRRRDLRHPEPAILRRDPLAAPARAGGVGDADAPRGPARHPPARALAARDRGARRRDREAPREARRRRRPLPGHPHRARPRRRRQGGRARAHPRGHARQWPHPHRGLPGPGQDAHRPARRPDARPRLQAHPVHARSPAQRHHRQLPLRPARGALRVPPAARSSPTCCSPTRSTGPRPRRRARCSRRCRRRRSPSRASASPSSRRSS